MQLVNKIHSMKEVAFKLEVIHRLRGHILMYAAHYQSLFMQTDLAIVALCFSLNNNGDFLFVCFICICLADM